MTSPPMDSVAPILALMALHPSHQMASVSWQISLKWRATLSIESPSFSSLQLVKWTFSPLILCLWVSYLCGNGIAFAISRTADLSTALASWHLGLYIVPNDRNSTNHIFLLLSLTQSWTTMLELMSMAWCPWSCILPVTIRIALVCSRTWLLSVANQCKRG